MTAWPSDLPQAMLVGSNYKEDPLPSIVSTSMDVGKPKYRQRFTASWVQITGYMVCNVDQVSTLLAFYYSQGVTPFDWVHPRTGASGSFQFMQTPPAIQSIAADEYQVTLIVIALP